MSKPNAAASDGQPIVTGYVIDLPRNKLRFARALARPGGLAVPSGHYAGLSRNSNSGPIAK